MIGGTAAALGKQVSGHLKGKSKLLHDVYLWEMLLNLWKLTNVF